MSDKPKYTYAHLLAHLQRLTPAQLAHQVRWCGEERGGRCDGLGVLREDQCNPSGDGWEPKSQVVQTGIDSGDTEEQARDFAEGEIVGRAGTPFLFMDNVGDGDLWAFDVCDHARVDVTAACGACGSPGVALP